MMSKRLLLVVGDKFVQFASGKEAITLSQLHILLSDKSKVMPNQVRTVLVPGQGLGDDDVSALLEKAQTSANRDSFDFRLWQSMPKRATRLMSHKHNPENTLISEPVKLCEDIYELHLLIDEDCELMRDHQSGQHVQGMVLMEAARQSLLAVTEKYFLAGNGEKYAFVFNDMSVKYNHFAFPLQARLRYTIKEKDISKKNRCSFSCEVAVEQCGTDTAVFDMVFSAIEHDRISKREGMFANKAVNAYLTDINIDLDEQNNDLPTQQANIA